MALLLIFDCNNLAFRAYYAIEGKNLKTKSGLPSGALYLFTKMLVKALKEKKPNYVAATFDISKETFRKKLYQDYKAQRKPIPQELASQLPHIQNLVKILNIKLITHQNFEADDLIGSLAYKFKHNKDLEIQIITGDRDILQLLDANIKVDLCIKGVSETKLLDKDSFIQLYGFDPISVIDLKALQGDTSDNIPGVNGIGEKKALALIKQFQTIENIYNSLDIIDNKSLKQQLINGKDNAFLSKKLATIDHTIIDIPDLNDLKWESNNLVSDVFYNFLISWEFYSIVKDLFPNKKNAITSNDLEIPYSQQLHDQNHSQTLNNPSLIYIGSNNESYKNLDICQNTPSRKITGERLLVTSQNELENFLSSSDVFAISIEYDNTQLIRQSRIFGFSFAKSTESAIYIPTSDRENLLTDSIPINILKEILAKHIPNKKIIGHNLKATFTIFNKLNIPLPKDFFDIMLAVYLLDPAFPNDLDKIATELFRYEYKKPSKPLTGKNNELPAYEACIFSCQNSLIIQEIYKILENKLIDSNQYKLFKEIEQPLLLVLLEMEETGIKLEKNYLATLNEELTKEILKLEQEIYKKAGIQFKINSPKQLQEVLYNKLGLSASKKTKTGLSTDSNVLKELAAKHPICNDIINYRELMKLKTTYIESLQNLVDPSTGLIHTTFNQTVTATGRLSSTNPNLQNIPIKTDLGKKIRRAFIPPIPNHVFVSIDYSQIELRLLAHLSEDKNLIEAFKNNLDIHSITASKLFNIPIDKVSEAERKVGKTVNFGIIYGISAHGLAESLGISRSQAKSYIDNFFKNFPAVESYFNNAILRARMNGYVSTIFGHIRYLRNLNSKDHNLRAFEERVARNTPLQGSAADLVKKAMLEVNNYLKENNYETKLVLQIHDELVFTSPLKEYKNVVKKLKEIMENVVTLKVPLVCDVAYGPNLADLQEIKFE